MPKKFKFEGATHPVPCRTERSSMATRAKVGIAAEDLAINRMLIVWLINMVKGKICCTQALVFEVNSDELLGITPILVQF
jgi:hypothetical protein